MEHLEVGPMHTFPCSVLAGQHVVLDPTFIILWVDLSELGST